jgi:hypothetical protein|tara:strand:+ start:60 stop:485 length:426 start_codon:yes stop_codon:yes gene_type:complete
MSSSKTFLHGETREDGFTFNHYYYRGDKKHEAWYSPETVKKIKVYKKKHKKERVSKIKKYIRRVKLFLGCIVCGYKKHPHALHFDHVDVKNKKKEISGLVTYSLITVKNEMRKCRVLCANCHAEHTATQIEEGVFNYETDT